MEVDKQIVSLKEEYENLTSQREESKKAEF